MNLQFPRFLLVGAVAAAANIATRSMVGIWFDYLSSVTIAFLVGLVTAYLLNRSWVFDASGRHWLVEAAWFTGINLLGLVLTIVVSWCLARMLFPVLGLVPGEPWDTLAHAIGVAATVATSFLGHKYFTFRKLRHA